MVELLTIPYDATIKLQSESLTPGDFLKVWKEVIFQLDQKEGSIAEDMVEAMREREVKLLSNRFVVAAVWVDARYRILLTPTQKETAKAALQETYERMKTQTSGSPAPSATSSPHSSFALTQKRSRFDEYLDSLEPQERLSPVGHFAEITREIERLGRVTANSVWDIINMYPIDTNTTSLPRPSIHPDDTSIGGAML